MDSRLSEFEIAQIGNLTPTTAEEAKQIVPSVAGSIDDGDLQRILDDLSTTRKYES